MAVMNASTLQKIPPSPSLAPPPVQRRSNRVRSISDGTTRSTQQPPSQQRYSVTGLDLSSLDDGTLPSPLMSTISWQSATQATDSTTKDSTPPPFPLPSTTAVMDVSTLQKIPPSPSLAPPPVQRRSNRYYIPLVGYTVNTTTTVTATLFRHWP